MIGGDTRIQGKSMELLEFDGPIGKSPAGLEMFRRSTWVYMHVF